jgi:hypothetical protein
MEEQSNRFSWQMAAVLAAAQSRPADETGAVLEEEQSRPAAVVLGVFQQEEHNHPAAVVLEVAPEEEQSRLLAVCQEAVQEGARSPLAVYSAGDAAGDAADCDIPVAGQSTGLPLHFRYHNSAPASEEGRCFSHSDCQNTCLRFVYMNPAIDFTVSCYGRLRDYI